MSDAVAQLDAPAAPAADEPIPELPQAAAPHAPSAGMVWRRALIVAWLLVAWMAFDRITLLLLDYWLLEELGYTSVFWTNFKMQLGLFIVGGTVFAAAVVVPVLAHGVRKPARRTLFSLAALVGLVGGYNFSGDYLNFFQFFQGKGFGEQDPVFHHDIGFYVFDYPVLTYVADHLIVAAGLGMIVSAALAYRTRQVREPRPDMSRPARFAGILATPCTQVFLVAFGIALAFETFLGRYAIVYADNSGASVFNGATRLDITGFFSRLNLITVETIALLLGTVGVTLRLRRLHHQVREAPSASAPRMRLFPAVTVLVPGIVVIALFTLAIGVRSTIQVVPNQPVTQYPYIQRHIDATRDAYGLDEIETEAFIPASGDDPKPSAEELLSSPSLADAAPLWPGYVSWLERLVDAQHADRILLTEGDTMIYGPTLETFSQEQKLRAYYDFLDVDTVRYEVDGKPKLFASSVREVPLLEPKPWLAYWGQRFLLFTHGQGMVMSPLGETGPEGGPAYASAGIPVEVSEPALEVENQAVYYGEGSSSMAYTGIHGLEELDFPTDEGRAQVTYEGDGGVELDSFVKRAVFGYRSGQLFQIAFSDLIGGDTKVHYYRTPLERLERVAPFLFLDTDPYAVAAGDGEGITWMVNGMTHTDRYPYSRMGELGDKADRRTPTPRAHRNVNYVRDSVKATVDSYTGKVELYQWESEPIIDTWASVYPDLFADRSEMPDDVEDQVQYPRQLFHLQFDDLYIYYHMAESSEFFNLEDAWDDGDDVVGPVIDDGDSITFSIEPYPWLVETGDTLPASSEDTQFAQSMVFTNENSLNLRAITTVYQTGDDYGKLSVLQVPKGKFYPGPEQADSAIDQDAFIAQQIGFWTRQGLEAIRGHTTPIVIGDEVLYIEPIYTRSEQNRIPHLERVIVVFRGQPYMGRNLEEAITFAVEARTEDEIGQPLFPLDS